jgi:hypothetical protein
MMKGLHLLSNRASLLRPHTGDRLDFGEIVAMLIVLIGLMPFVTAGLWVSP